MARFVTETLKAKTAAVFQDLKSDYSNGLSTVFKDKFSGLGGKIVAEEKYSAGDFDFKAQLTAIRSAKPDFIYLPGYYTDIGLILRQARELGITTTFGGGDGWDSEKIYEIGGKALDGSYFSNHYSSESKGSILEKFVKTYRAKYGSTPDGLAALGYDAAHVLFAAMKRAKSLSGPDLRDAIATTKGFAGVTGITTINNERNTVKSAVVLKIQGKKQHYVTTINP
jgi:branched-chain amino acid transport system substrate-binding protein